VPTVAAFPKALQWQEWWEYHQESIHSGQPWVRFLVDATTALQQMFVGISRRLRQKPDWDTRGWSPEEWLPVIEVAEEKLAWFRLNKPRMNEIPAWAQILLQALDGAYLMLARLSREVEQIQRKGYLLVNVSPLTPGDLAERGEEEE